MAQTFQTTDSLLVIPGAYPNYTVQSNSSGLADNGILIIIGEATGGPDFTYELSQPNGLQGNAFGPDQAADVVFKYKSGPLVDAFQASCVPSNDVQVTGAPFRMILVKTNVSGKAFNYLTKIGGGNYGVLADRNYGKLGNLIYFSVAQKTPEIRPTTGPFTFLPPIGTFNANLRVNGGANLPLSIAPATLPDAFKTAVDALTGVDATGGTNRGIITVVAGNLSVAALGNVISLVTTSTWTTIPTPGDTLYIPAGSAVQGATNKNRGSYLITSANTTTIIATKLMDGTGTPGTLTAPENVAATPVVAITDAMAFAPVVITLSNATPIDGIGKSLEINELTTGTDLISNCCYALSTTKVNWISKTSAPYLLTSSSEYSVTLNVNRQFDNIQESMTTGGSIALKLGYIGTTASVAITSTTFTTTVTGGAGTSLTLNFSDFPTINDLVTYLKSQPGYIADVGTATLGQQSPSRLDKGTFTFATDFGAQTGRIKIDAYQFFNAIQTSSILVQFGLTAPFVPADAGLPAVTPIPLYLSGGTQGFTTDSTYQVALEAVEGVRGNFVIPTFSRDASLDIIDGVTDSSSTYTIATIHAATRAHVLAMSTRKKRKNRQAFLSVRDTFVNAKTTASQIASHRSSLTFQDYKTVTSGSIKQFQPWMAAINAASFSAAAFYRGIVNKYPLTNGIVAPFGDFSDQNDSQTEDALLSGLLFLRRDDNDIWKWVSDQTTYTADNNFVYNSIQAIYMADIAALTTSKRMERAFVGQSLADVTVPVAEAAFDSIMSDLRALKVIAPSQEASKGYKNLLIRINGPVMQVSAQIFLATLLYFIPIDFLVSPVQQSTT